MRIDFRFGKSPVLAGLFCGLLLLAGCPTDQPPETVTRLFWRAVAADEIEVARRLATESTRDSVGKTPRPAWKIETLTTGEVRIDGAEAVVETEVAYDRPDRMQTQRFDTFLRREGDAWKVDYRKTRDFMPLHPFGELLQNLQNFGETFGKQLGKQLEKQLPQLEEGMQKFGEQLNRQLEEQMKEFERDLEKAFPPPGKQQKKPPADSI